jgi:hypothetical protein
MAYPIFPVVPVAVADLGSKSPPLAPEKNQDPERNQKMRKADKAAADHVAPQLLSPSYSEIPGRMATVAVTVCPHPSHHAPRASHDLVPDGGAGIVGG